MSYMKQPFALVLMLLATQLAGASSADGVDSQPLACDELLETSLEQANRGDAAAQSRLGGIYLNGYCLDQDYAAALNWYEKAAQAGDGEAMLALGNIYARGYGVSPNLDMTLKWLRLAEDKGQITGRVYAFLYLDGVLVSQSIGRAYSFFLQAAEAGDPAAQYTVSMEYFRGQHLEKNPALALTWLTRSAENGYGPAYRVLGGIYAHGSYGIARDNAKAGKWLALAKQQNKATALDVAQMYLEGQGVSRDIDKAIEYYNELADEYVAEAHLKLGLIYSYGPPLTPDYELAEEHFQMAEVLGSVEAAYHLGLLRLNGQGMRADRAAAKSMFTLAADNGYVFANYYLGLLAYNGPGGARDRARAHKLFGAAAQTADPDLAAQAYEAENAVAIELGLLQPAPGMPAARVDRWPGAMPGKAYVYVHRPRERLIPPIEYAKADNSPEVAADRQPAATVPATYDPPPPPLLTGVPGGDINSVDRKIEPVL